jgi:hypothetical protein
MLKVHAVIGYHYYYYNHGLQLFIYLVQTMSQLLKYPIVRRYLAIFVHPVANHSYLFIVLIE